MQSFDTDIKLNEVMQFAEWIQLAREAITKRERIPESPKLDAGKVSSWIQTIRNLEDLLWESEQHRGNLESELRDRKENERLLTVQQQASIAQSMSAQSISHELHRTVARYREAQTKVDKLVREIVGYCGKRPPEPGP